MSVTITGLREVDKLLSDIDRKVTRERKGIIRTAANATLVKAMRDDAQRAPGKAGPLLATATNARFGKGEAVVVGPRGGKKGLWWRHFFMVGSQGHQIGAAKAGGTREFFSAARQAREAGWANTRGGLFKRSSQGRRRVFMSNIGYPDRAVRGEFRAMGPIRHGGIRPTPFVKTGEERAGKAFVDMVAGLIFGTRSQGASSAPNPYQP